MGHLWAICGPCVPTWGPFRALMGLFWSPLCEPRGDKFVYTLAAQAVHIFCVILVPTAFPFWPIFGPFWHMNRTEQNKTGPEDTDQTDNTKRQTDQTDQTSNEAGQTNAEDTRTRQTGQTSRQKGQTSRQQHPPPNPKQRTRTRTG